MTISILRGIPLGMWRRRYVILVIVLLACLLSIFISLQPAEPSYEGRSLSQWFDDRMNEKVSYSALTNAIEHIGVQALPFLAKYIQYEEKPWQTATVRRLRANFPNLQLARNWETKLEHLRVRRLVVGRFIFPIFGPRAESVIPLLSKSLNRPQCAEPATLALGNIGEKGFPPIVAALTNKAAAFQIKTGLINLQAKALPAIPLLVRNLQSANTELAQQSALVLGKITPRLKSNLPALRDVVLPALQDALKDPRPEVRRAVIEALTVFGEPGLPALRQAFNDPDPSIRAEATNQVNNVNPN